MSRLPIATRDLGGAPKVEAALSLRQKTFKRAKREFGILGPPLAQRPLVYRVKPPPHPGCPAIRSAGRHRQPGGRLRRPPARRASSRPARAGHPAAGCGSSKGSVAAHRARTCRDRRSGRAVRRHGQLLTPFSDHSHVHWTCRPGRGFGGRALVPSHLHGSQRHSLAAVLSHRVRGCRSRLNL